ncbi:hypothetical protein [Marinivivus vitaminiproducens]|uniref:COG3904 family protein n=1 Tax=Marinivivus vitaminiproducens TaxID=3035935 RepID=UPI00279A4762|nr:hypothetical protein P4R82_15950 [Geminicoccaceae bacterium SCSIO 64248]
MGIAWYRFSRLFASALLLDLAGCIASEPYVIATPVAGSSSAAPLPTLALPKTVYLAPAATATPEAQPILISRPSGRNAAVAKAPLAVPAPDAAIDTAPSMSLAEPQVRGAATDDRGRLGVQASWRLLTVGTAVIEGSIGTGFAVDLERLLKTRPDIGTFLLRSGGGSLVESLLAGMMVRRHGRSTAVLDTCASACIYLYAGGTERIARVGARLGVHQIRVGAEDDRIEAGALQDALAWIQDYLTEMSISPSLLNLSLTAPADTMRWLSPSQMTQTGLVTTWL